jgi:hypothetical protein
MTHFLIVGGVSRPFSFSYLCHDIGNNGGKGGAFIEGCLSYEFQPFTGGWIDK